jgi:hypothetical protein
MLEVKLDYEPKKDRPTRSPFADLLFLVFLLAIMAVAYVVVRGCVLTYRLAAPP